MMRGWFGERLRRRDAVRERRKAPGVLERIARRHQPPDAVEAEPPHGDQAGGAVGVVRRIERSAEQADLHAGGVGGKHGHQASNQSQTAGPAKAGARHGRDGKKEVTDVSAPSRGRGS